jgi:hypothetical protein
MASYPRLVLKFAAVAGIAALLSSTAVAAGTARGARTVASQHRVWPTRSNQDCAGAWCGRQFVLMIGVAY